MTLSLAGTRKDAGVSIAEVNLKLIWDVVSQIKVGERGHAYVVGAQGRLIAHPDISLVLRNTDMSKLVQVQAAQNGTANSGPDALQGARNIQGQEVLTASAPIAPLGWTMFVELPVEEAYASLYLALQRLAIVLLGALIFAVFAGVFLARRMVVPIQALRAGAERMGGGDFAQRISIKTGDELEGLANQFNDMGARLQESYTDLEKKVQLRTTELSETLQQQTATADVLKVISRSAFDLKSVLTTLTKSAKALCGANSGVIFLRDGDVLRLQAESGAPPAMIDFLREHPIKAGRETISGRVFMDGKLAHLPDVTVDPEYNFGMAPELGEFRATLGVPLMRDGAVEGVLTLTRPEPGPFTARQIELVRTFADQAVIAIENARLFTQVQDRTRELSLSLDELRTAQDRLVQTEKLASLGQLTAGIAHEIENPLNFVNNFSALSAELVDELNDVLKPAALDDKVREEIDELTHMLKGNLEKVVQHGKRAEFDREKHAAAFARRRRRTPLRRHQRHCRGEPQSGLSWRPRRKIRLQHHPAAPFRFRRRHDRPLSTGNHPGISQSDLERVLCCHQAQGSRRGTLRTCSERDHQKPRQQGRNPDPRQWHRHPSGSEGENVQSVLHHQTRGRGHRAWPVDEP